MGGEVFVGIRWRDSTGVHEQCSLRWTNIMPWFMASPSLYTKGKAFKDLVERAKPHNRWPQSRLTHEIEPSEYGVILFDFVNKTVFSRQRYNGPGTVCMYLNDEEDRKLFLEMAAGKMFTGVKGGLSCRVRSPIALIKACQQNRMVLKDFIIAHYAVKNWNFDHKSEVGRDCWAEVRAFVKTSGWRSRIWTINRATKNETIALAGIGILKRKR